jgi:hypothetical protein
LIKNLTPVAAAARAEVVRYESHPPAAIAGSPSAGSVGLVASWGSQVMIRVIPRWAVASSSVPETNGAFHWRYHINRCGAAPTMALSLSRSVMPSRGDAASETPTAIGGPAGWVTGTLRCTAKRAAGGGVDHPRGRVDTSAPGRTGRAGYRGVCAYDPADAEARDRTGVDERPKTRRGGPIDHHPHLVDRPHAHGVGVGRHRAGQAPKRQTAAKGCPKRAWVCKKTGNRWWVALVPPTTGIDPHTG